MFIQTRRFSAPIVREVMTRDMQDSTSYATDRKLAFPRIVAVRSVWEPDDSKHGGKMYLSGEVHGAPMYEDFGEGEWGAAWRKKLADIKKGLEENYCAHLFNERRIAEWRQFLERYPMGGLGDVPLSARPPFLIPSFVARPSRPGDEQVVGMLTSAGEDKKGRHRLYYQQGEDMLEYSRALSKATYNGFYLDGKAYAKKRVARGESAPPPWVMWCCWSHRAGSHLSGFRVHHLITKLTMFSNSGVTVVKRLRSLCRSLWCDLVWSLQRTACSQTSSFWYLPKVCGQQATSLPRWGRTTRSSHLVVGAGWGG